MNYNPHPERKHTDATDNGALQELAKRRLAQAQKDIRDIRDATDGDHDVMTPKQLQDTARANATATAWEEVRKLAYEGKLPYTEPVATPTEFERVRMITESGEKQEALLTSNMGIGDLHLAKDQYSEEHVRAAREVQAVRHTMTALASVLNIDGLKTWQERFNNEGSELTAALPFSEKTNDHWTEDTENAIYTELSHQEELGYNVFHDDAHHSPETMLQHAAKYRTDHKYVKFAAYAAAAARLALYRMEATKAGVALYGDNHGEVQA